MSVAKGLFIFTMEPLGFNEINPVGITFTQIL